MPGSTAPPWPLLPVPGPDIVGAEGAWLIAADGSRILDAAGGAIVANVGHGRREVVDALAEATARTTYVVPPWPTPERTGLVEDLRARWLPEGLDRVHLSCGGSEAVEAGLKLALVHWLARGEPQRHRIIGRHVSYHGTTLGTLAVGGHAARKSGYAHTLPEHPRVSTPWPLRCPLGPHHPDAGRFYADELDALIRELGPETVAAYVAEPVLGASAGAVVPPDDYWPRVREICDRHGVLLIADEVMTGFGRCGERFALDHWRVRPDILVSGKGLAGGYAPICATVATDAVVQPLEDAGLDFMYHTFGALPGACAAARAVLAIMEREDLVRAARDRGLYLTRALEARFGDHPHVAETRGLGLLQGIELVADRETLTPFPQEAGLTRRVMSEGLARGAFFYGAGTGVARDMLILGPPFTVTEGELDLLVERLGDAVDAALAQVGGPQGTVAAAG
jgi:adenosylmethionine-8-amino-7-oxononanoate aminotransferase